MKRDWKTVRAILEAIEQEKYIEFQNSGGVDEQTLKSTYKDDVPELLSKARAKISLHLELLVESGLVTDTAADPDGKNGMMRLTMTGYDMLDALRDESVFAKLKEHAVKAGITLSWEFIKQAIPVIYRHML